MFNYDKFLLEKNNNDLLNIKTYMIEYWDNLITSMEKDDKTHFSLPHKYISPSPNDTEFDGDQYYWDSYFIILGLVESGDDYIELAKGIIDNIVYMFEKYEIIPKANKFYELGTTQPPFLTSMILEVYGKIEDDEWLKKVVLICEEELKEVWEKKYRYIDGLSRYADNRLSNDSSEDESGWDLTSRFNNECFLTIPIDLNSCLYKYEKDISYIYNILGDKEKEKLYLDKSENRKKKINDLMWNDTKGFYFDYNTEKGKMNNFYSLAGFFPLWAGLVDDDKIDKIIKNIKKFDEKGGLVATQKTKLLSPYRQWDYPNGWANLQYIVVKGLLNYQKDEIALNLTNKWLNTVNEVYKKTQKIWEKYDVINIDKGKDGRYPTQYGFGWTNGVFIKLYNMFV